MKSRITKLAAAAAIVLGGIALWPERGSRTQKWWLEPSAAWGREISAALDAIKGVSCREQTILMMADGSRHTSSTWDVLFFSRDSYRRDIYDGNDLREIQWYIPDGNDLMQTSVRFDLGSCSRALHGGGFGDIDPVERMRSYVDSLQKTDPKLKHFLGERLVEDQNCVGFAISASRLGDHPPEWVLRIWFDIDTKLPALVEQEITTPRDKAQADFQPLIAVLDQFDYDPDLPLDTFIPVVPDGFIYGHPDEIQAATEQERQQ